MFGLSVEVRIPDEVAYLSKKIPAPIFTGFMRIIKPIEIKTYVKVLDAQYNKYDGCIEVLIEYEDKTRAWKNLSEVHFENTTDEQCPWYRRIFTHGGKA